MKIIFLLVFLLAGLAGPAQTNGNLDRDNGFLDIHLLADIDSVPGFISIFKDPDIDMQKYDFAMYGSQYTYAGNKYTHFGNAAVSKIFLATTKGYITGIKVICPHDSSVISTLFASYGKPTIPFKVMPAEDKKTILAIAMWMGEKVRLTLTTKKYLGKKNSADAEPFDYIYLDYTSLRGE